jgi:hypothetical protein
VSVTNDQRRPVVGTGVEEVIAATSTSIAGHGDVPPAEIELVGGGLIAVMGSRSFFAGCLDCDAKFDTKHDVVSHVHGARHRAECDDRVAYTYAPAELLDGVR